MINTLREMPEQHFPVYKLHSYKMNRQYLLPIETGRLELSFFEFGAYPL